MLPEIPDNDTDRCWARGCGDPAGGIHTGLCFVHNQRIRSHLQEGREITAHVFDLLGLRLNVLEETGGACLRASGPCDLRICRYHLDDAGTETAREHQDLSEPCAVKLAGNGTLTLEDVASRLGCTRERTRQLEVAGLKHLGEKAKRGGMGIEDPRPGRERAA